MKVKDAADYLTCVKKRVCVRKQYAKKFGTDSKTPYLCIVNQRERC